MEPGRRDLRTPVGRWLLGAGLLMLIVAGPAASQDLAQPLPLDPAIRTGTLPNGFTYFIRKNTRPQKRASLRLAVNAGSIDETDQERGLAHLIEHMGFNGTTHFKPGELVKYLESIGAGFGADVNASTSYDETIYMLDVPTDREGLLDRGLLAMSDFAGGDLFIPSEVDSEKKVVIEEWRQRRGAGARVEEKQAPVLYGQSKYAVREPIGLVNIIQGATPAQLRAFYEKWYRPDRMALIVVGDFDPAEVQKQIVARFSALRKPATAAPPRTYPIPPHATTRVSMVTDPETQQSTVTILQKRPVEIETRVGDYRRSLVENLVFQMLNARFAEIAREPSAPFLGASSGADVLGRTVEAFVLSARVPEGGVAAGLSALSREEARVTKFGFGAGELDRARRNLLASYERMYNERNTSENAGLAAELVRHFLEHEPVPGIEKEFEYAKRFVPAITAQETADAARRMMGIRSRVVLAVAPLKAGLSEPSIADLQKAFDAGAQGEIAAWQDESGSHELMARKPDAGTVTSTRQIPEIGVTVLTLSNGVQVWLKPTDFKSDQVVFTSYAKGGLSLAPPSEYQDDDLAINYVDIGGVGGFTPVQLEKMLAGQTASAAPYIGTYTHGVAGTSSTRDLETALQLLHLDFTTPNFTPQAFDLLRTRLRAALANRAQNPNAAFGEKVEEVNTEGNYSAKPLRIEDVDKLRAEVMKNFYVARFANAADFTFFMAGAFSLDQVTPLVARYIGSLPSKGVPTSKMGDLRLQFPPDVRRESIRKGQEPKSQTLISFFADTKLDELEMHRLRAATSVLEMRLTDIIREEMGGTYGVNVGYTDTNPVPGYGMVQVGFGSAPENVDTLVAAVMKEVARLKQEGPSVDDLQKVKEIEKRNLETQARTNGYWINSLQTVHALGWDPVSIARRPQRTESLTEANVHEAFKKYFPDTRYTVISLFPDKK
jgi:zinc protease